MENIKPDFSPMLIAKFKARKLPYPRLLTMLIVKFTDVTQKSGILNPRDKQSLMPKAYRSK
ncbi:hypothetical protein CK510_02180 [Brunnivagina elsteri CCALA 953]|uniref:Uncharacterized protein n=1 Tax=Brunnivagina elsteri CCALA 953 TaxID=987040 RepID=A0A2A2TPC4_9CYAN|nr:hypothetical protein CK510_02180 [Calothrix elsteri CCALA 953]